MKSNVARVFQASVPAILSPFVLNELINRERGEKCWTDRSKLAHCEENPLKSELQNRAPVPRPSWLRKTLRPLIGIPLPRKICSDDPDLVLSPRHQAERKRSEIQLAKIQQEIQLVIDSKENQLTKRQRVDELVNKSYALLYGKNLTPFHRQSFLERYGCTGWTDDILKELLSLGSKRGFVEIGAGNGQWARALTEFYQDQVKNPRKAFDFCLAYDNMSALPLDPQVYHGRTPPHRLFFFPKVRPLDSIEATLQQWSCRGRVLMLVYPPPDSDMAFEALRVYTETCPQNDTVVYVGEGRRGTNANDAFFDYLESTDWILWKIMPVTVFGDKGYEKLFVFKRLDSSEDSNVPC